MKDLLIILTCFIFFQSCNQAKTNENIIGVKIYEHQGSYDALIKEWVSIGINTAFVGKNVLANRDFRIGAAENHIKTFAILPIFFDAEALTENPDLYAIKSNGEKAIDEWVKFVCPSDADFRKDKVTFIINLLKAYHPDGLSIDFIRHFVYWEKVYPGTATSSLPNACFDSRCIDKFQDQSGIQIPTAFTEIHEISSWIMDNHLEAWTEWKGTLITSMIEEIAEKARAVDPQILINVHIVPWRQHDFEKGITYIAGQDLNAISKITDYLSPMTYAHMVKQDAAWVHDVVADIYSQTGSNVLPSIQVKEEYLTDSLSSQVYELNLQSALMTPSQGVVFYSWEHLDQDPWKKEIIRNIVK